jgi:RNA polymerase sigma-70 factor (ECF subfamily)
MQSDEMLVRAVLAGQNTAYAKLYDRYAALVRAICYDGTQNLADAQDLAQDVFLRAYEKLHQLRDPDCFGKWLVRIARLCCKEWQRQKSRHRHRHNGLKNAGAIVSDRSNDCQIENLRKMITMLPQKERLALHAFYLQGRSADNACRVMGLSRSGFYRVLERARKRLERLLVKEQEAIK